MGNRAPSTPNIDMDEVNRKEERLPPNILAVIRMSKGRAWKSVQEKLQEQIDLETEILLKPGKKKLEYTADDLLKMSIDAKKALLNIPKDIETEYINKKNEKEDTGADPYE